MNFDKVLGGILANFITAGKVIGAYFIARYFFKHYQKNGKERILITYLRIILAVIVISVFMWALPPGAISQDEDGYSTDIPVPSQKYRNELGIKNFVTFLIPALYGCYKENKNRLLNKLINE